MQFKKPEYKLTTIISVIGVFVFMFLGLVYIQRLRNALINSTESYKMAIVELENKVIAQGVYVTNDISKKYNLEVEPSSVRLNSVPVDIGDISNPVSFMIAGHIYGSHDKEIIPSSTLINSVDKINQLSPNMFFSLGDMMRHASEQSYQDLHENFLDRINAPVFNAPGNHDFSNGRSFYEDKFGQTFYYFKYASTQIITLDTEMANCFIVGKQETMLQEALSSALDDPEINNILIFTHRVIFLDSSQPLSGHVNASCFSSNFSQLLENHFIPSSKEKPIYIFAGDVGAFEGGHNLSPYYQKIPDQDIYLIATGLGDGLYDKVILADISSSKLSFKIISLNGEDTFPLEKYDHEYWIEYYNNKKN